MACLRRFQTDIASRGGEQSLTWYRYLLCLIYGSLYTERKPAPDIVRDKGEQRIKLD
jgi:hypothetical protein